VKVFSTLWLAVCVGLIGSPDAQAQAAPDEKKQPAPEAVESIVVQGKFIETGAKSAMKMDIDVRDTPFSVSSYSESFMKAIETTNVADMYKYMTGVARTGGSGNDLNMRGFSMTAEDRNAILVNGLPGLAGRFGSPPTVAVERIEVVKGPSSVLYGAAQPGGFVNIVSKRPEGTRSATIDLKAMGYQGHGLSLGDDFGYSGSMDFTGPIDADRKFRYRLVGEYLDRDLFRTGAWEKDTYLAPSLTWKIANATSATVIFEHRKSDNAYDLGLAVPLNDISRAADIKTRYQQPDDFRNEVDNAVTALANHAFSENVTWNFGARVVKHHDDAAGFDQTGFITSGVARDGSPCTPTAPCLRMRARGQHNEREWSFLDTNVNLNFATGFVGHRMLVGLNGGREIANFERLQFSNGLASCPTATTFNCLTQNLYNPVYDLPALSTLPKGNLNNQITTSYAEGIYASDVMTLSEHWKATAGARYSWDRQSIKDDKYHSVPTQYKENHKGIPMAGLLYQPSAELTFYTSYATSFVPAPANAQDETGANPFKPEQSAQVEAGAKYDRADANLTATAALFQIDKKDVLTFYSCALGTCAQQLGKVRSKGLELELNWRPLDGLQLTAGYAYTDAQVTNATDPLLVGARLVNVPKNSAHMWTRYDFSGDLHGLGVGVGVSYIGDRAGTLRATGNTTVLRLPAYTVVDAGVYYAFSRYAFTLKVNNLFDKTIIESSGFEAGPLQVTPGAPRNVQLSMRVHF
jgi:iron complex outermembrane receptor protein